MNKYEVLYIIRPTLTEEEMTQDTEKWKTLIESMGGEVTSIEKWGKKKLSYEVKKLNEGYYVLMNMTCNSDAVDELCRLFRISDTVFRHLLVRAEA